MLKMYLFCLLLSLAIFKIMNRKFSVIEYDLILSNSQISDEKKKQHIHRYDVPHQSQLYVIFYLKMIVGCVLCSPGEPERG